jgi:hypothetical protein
MKVLVWKRCGRVEVYAVDTKKQFSGVLQKVHSSTVLHSRHMPEAYDIEWNEINGIYGLERWVHEWARYDDEDFEVFEVVTVEE